MLRVTMKYEVNEVMQSRNTAFYKTRVFNSWIEPIFPDEKRRIYRFNEVSQLEAYNALKSILI